MFLATCMSNTLVLCVSGRNLADALALLDCQPHFISTVGSDPLGQCILHHNSKLDKKSIHINPSKATATYCLTLTNEGTYICYGQKITLSCIDFSNLFQVT